MVGGVAAFGGSTAADETAFDTDIHSNLIENEELNTEDDIDPESVDVRLAVDDSNTVSKASGESVNIWVGTVDEADSTTPIADVPVNITISPESDGEPIDHTTVETSQDGNANYTYTFDEDGVYYITAETIGESASVSERIGIGQERIVTTSSAFSSGTFVDEETTVAINVNDGGSPVVDEEIDINIRSPNHTVIKNTTIETDEDGFAKVSFTPSETGTYTIDSEDESLDRTNTDISVSEYIVNLAPANGYAGHDVPIAGYAYGSDGPYANDELVLRVFDDRDHTERTEVATTSAKTDESGLFEAEFTAPDEPDRYYFELETSDGEEIPLRVFDDLIDIEEPPEEDEDDSPHDPTASIDFMLEDQFEDDFARQFEPGDDVVFDVEARDEDGEPIDGESVSVVFQYGSDRVPAERTSVETNEHGIATGSVTLPDTAPIGWLEGEISMEYNDDVLTESVFLGTIQTHFMDIEDPADPIEPGSEAEIPITVTDSDGEPVEGETYAFETQYHYLQRSIETTSVTTGADGTASFTAEIPADIDHLWLSEIGTYESDRSSWSSGTDFGSQSWADVPIAHADPELNLQQDEVSPGETITVSIENNDIQSGIIRIGDFERTIGQELVSPGEEVEFTIPESALTFGYSVDVLAFSEDETRYQTSEHLRITDDPDTPDDGSSAPAEGIVIEPFFEVDPVIGGEVGEEITFNASNAQAFENDEEIEFDRITWNFGDGNTTTIDDPSEEQVVTHTYAESGHFEPVSATFEVDGVEETYSSQLFISNPITLNAEPTDPDVNVTDVMFTVEGAEYDDDEVALQYGWDVTDDGEFEAITHDPTFNYTYTEIGEVNATVNVRSELAPAEESVTIDVVDTIEPVAKLDVEGQPAVGQSLTANASESTDNNQIANYTWILTDTEDGSVILDNTTEEPLKEITISEMGNYTLEVIVTDESGNQNSTTEEIVVIDNTNLEVGIDADAEQVIHDVSMDAVVSNIGSQPAVDPFTLKVMANGTTYDGENETFTFEQEIDDLGENESLEVNVTTIGDWVENERIVGDVSLHAEVDPDNNISEITTENNIATGEIEVIYPDLVANSDVSDTIQNEDVTFRSYIRNNGTAPSEATNASVRVVDESDTTVFENDTIDIDSLDADDLQRERFVDSISQPGTYTLVVEVDDVLFPEGTESTTEFEVKPYEISVLDTETSVQDDLNRGQNFTAVFGYETNTDTEVNATLELPEEIELASDETVESRTVTDTPRPDRTNIVSFDLTAVESTDASLSLNFTVEDTVEIDTSDNTTANTNISVVTETVSNQTAITYDGTEGESSSAIEVFGDGISEKHNVSISVQAGPEGRTLQGLEYLVNYPYGCVEQTTSAFLGALNTHQYYEDRDDGDIDPDRQDVINGSIEEGIDRLAEDGIRTQKDDGSWNQWGREGQDGQTYFSALALYGLSQVDNDETYGVKNADRLDDVAFDEAVEWLAEDDNWAGVDGYLRDDPSAIGFVIISLEEADESDRTNPETEESIEEIYSDAAIELVELQDDPGSGTWNNENHRSTAFAVYGLQIALDAEAYANESQREDMEEAIENGANWLAANQNDDGAWDPYHSSPWYNAQGDVSKSTAISILALDAVDETEFGSEIQEGVDYLIDVYESDGSWGYPRATNMALEALIELADEQADRTMEVTLDGPDGEVVEHISVDADNPQITEEITENLDELRADGEGLEEVGVTVTDTSSGSGTVIVAIQTTQEVHEDALGGDD